jgi:hypothetical protein
LKFVTKRRYADVSISDLCITLILAKIWKLTIDFIVKNMMKLANMELCRGLYKALLDRLFIREMEDRQKTGRLFAEEGEDLVGDEDAIRDRYDRALECLAVAA